MTCSPGALWPPFGSFQRPFGGSVHFLILITGAPFLSASDFKTARVSMKLLKCSNRPQGFWILVIFVKIHGPRWKLFVYCRQIKSKMKLFSADCSVLGQQVPKWRIQSFVCVFGHWLVTVVSYCWRRLCDSDDQCSFSSCFVNHLKHEEMTGLMSPRF